MSTDLLPPSASPFERTLVAACDPTARLAPTIDALSGLKIRNPPPSLLPHLVYEYGLGMLSPYLPNLYELIGEGVDWMRIRGTVAAMDMALGWRGYAAEIENAPVRRRWWNSYQLALGRLRDDEADLIPLEGLARLSAPRRSDLWRGYHGYDARELEHGYGRWSQTLYSDQSGLVLAGGSAKWSFGRRVEIVHDMTEPELTALGVWAEPVEGADLAWADMGEAAWADMGGTSWGSDAATARSRAMIAGLGAGPAWAVYRAAGGAVIGYRRCRARHAVVVDPEGAYPIGGARYAPGAGTALYVEALTDFGDGLGGEAASVGLILSSGPAEPLKPGTRWAPPGALSAAGPIIAETPVTILFGRTVRERASFLLRF